MGELAAITGACERTVWRRVKGECAPTNSALQLIQLWYSSNEQFTPQTRGDFFAKKARQAAVYWLQRKSAKHLSGVKAPKFEPESNLKK